MELSIINAQADFLKLKEEWNDLLSRSNNYYPFLRHEYLTTWWGTLGGGEWDSGDLHILIARDEYGILQAVAPLFITQNESGENAVLFLGSVEISDYLDFIISPGLEETFLNLVLEHFHSSSLEWDVIDLYNLLEGSSSLELLKSLSEKRGWKYTESSLHHCPFIPLADDWETYLSGLRKKHRHEIRRKMRRLESIPGEYRWYIVEEVQKIEQEIQAFFDLMEYDPEKSAFLTSQMRNQMIQTIKKAFDAGWLQLAFLEVNGEKAAGYLNFDYQNRIWVYNSGINPEFLSLSPGWVLLSYLIKWSIENGKESFDFMRGDEAYKYRFGAVDRRVVRAVIQQQ